MLGEYVIVRPGSHILPRDDDSTASVVNRHRTALLEVRLAHGDAIRRSLNSTQAVNLLGMDISPRGGPVAPVRARITPSDNRSTCAIRHHDERLDFDGIRHPIGVANCRLLDGLSWLSPTNRPRCVDPLSKDVVVLQIRPGEDSTAASIGHTFWIDATAHGRCSACEHSVCSPEALTHGPQSLCIHGVLVDPGHEHPTESIGAHGEVPASPGLPNNTPALTPKLLPAVCHPLRSNLRG